MHWERLLFWLSIWRRRLQRSGLRFCLPTALLSRHWCWKKKYHLTRGMTEFYSVGRRYTQSEKPRRDYCLFWLWWTRRKKRGVIIQWFCDPIRDRTRSGFQRRGWGCSFIGESALWTDILICPGACLRTFNTLRAYAGHRNILNWQKKFMMKDLPNLQKIIEILNCLK